MLRNYLTKNMGLKIDFSQTYKRDDEYSRTLDNIPFSMFWHKMDVKVALQDLLESKKCLVVKWEDLYNFCKRSCDSSKYFCGTWLHMIRNYMEKYFPDLDLKWCSHSLEPFDGCDCENPIPPLHCKENIFVNILQMLCDRHSERTW
jgi:hypothetical protein